MALSRLFQVAATLVVMVALAAGCQDEEAAGGGPGGPPGGFGNPGAVPVDAVAPEVGPFTVHGDYPGEFVSDATAELASEVAGRVREVNVRLGDVVAEGDVLATVDPVTYRGRVAELRAAVSLSQAGVEEARVQKANLEADLARKEPLLARQLVTEREIEDLRAQLAAAEQKLQVAKANVDQSRARLQVASAQLDDTRIKAPFDGIVAERYVDVGAQVGPSQPLFRVVADDQIYLRLRLPEQDSGLVRLQMPVKIRVDAMGGDTVDGAVGRIAPALDPSTRTLRVDVMRADGADWGPIKAGMYGRGQIVLGEREQALTIPSQALQREADGSRYVWHVVDGKAQRSPVAMGLQGRDRTEIVEGIGPDARVVLRGHERLEPDAAVTIIGAPAPEPAERPEQQPGEKSTANAEEKSE